MDDTITIEECITRIDAIRHEIVSNSRDHFALSAGIAALYEMENGAPAVNRWIPVEDALPELDTMVIVCYYGSDCIFPMQGETVTEAIARQNKVPTVTMGFLSEEGWNGADMFPMMIRQTFWMNLPDAPLPEPPEKE